MATNVSFGTYTPPKEPWEETQFRRLSRAYYTQSINMMVDGLSSCITALTSLELNQCFYDPDETKGENNVSESARLNYLSAVTVFMDNCGKIIDVNCIKTEFKAVIDRSSTSYKFKIDKSYPIKKKKYVCKDTSSIHNSVIKNKKIELKSCKTITLNLFHEYIVEASLCNRRTDVNYTNMKVTKNREELSDLLGNLAIVGGAIGFVEAKGAEILLKGVEIFCYALDIEPKIGLAESMFPIRGPVHLDKKTKIVNFINVPADVPKNRLDNNNEYKQKVDGKVKFTDFSITDYLEQVGFKKYLK